MMKSSPKVLARVMYLLQTCADLELDDALRTMRMTYAAFVA